SRRGRQPPVRGRGMLRNDDGTNDGCGGEGHPACREEVPREVLHGGHMEREGGDDGGAALLRPRGPDEADWTRVMVTYVKAVPRGFGYPKSPGEPFRDPPSNRSLRQAHPDYQTRERDSPIISVRSRDGSRSRGAVSF